MVIGIDIGTYSVKIIGMIKDDNGYTIQKSGCKPIFENIQTYDPEKIASSNLVATIQDLSKELNINPKKIKTVVSSISGKNVSIKQISTLEMSGDELTASLEFEAKKHIALDGTEAVLDYHLLGSDPNELDKTNVLLVALTKKLVNQHDKIIRDSGYKPTIFDTDPIALTNCYLNQKTLPKDGADVIINIGTANTTLIIWGENSKYFTRELSIAGHHFTQSVVKLRKINYQDAEELKFSIGIESSQSNSEASPENISSEIKMEEQTIYMSLIDELRKTLRYYMKSNSQSFFNNFFITGGSTNLPGLIDFINNQLKIELQILNPLEKINNNTKINNASQFTTAIGLAIRGFESSK
tara:strand:+ start:4063 stop:5124 length:1062 start_codon:yes stop_codon:yes gene_type:complete